MNPSATTVGPTDLRARAEATAEILSDYAPRADELRRLPQETIDALDAAGMFQIFTPAEFGGFEADLGTLTEVVMTLAGSCPSSAWCVVIANGSNLLAAHFPDEARQEVFGQDPRARLASVFSPSGAARPAPGGYRVSGNWPWASGCLHATWGIGMAPILDEDGTPVGMGMPLIPMSDLDIEDTWFTVGMRGTGSNTMVADDVFVPAHRMLPAEKVLAGSPEATNPAAPHLMRCSLVSTLVNALAAAVVGVAQGAHAYVAEKAPRRAITYTRYETQTSSEAFTHNLGAAALRIAGAVQLVRRGSELVDDAAAAARALSLHERRLVRGQTGHAVNEIVDALNTLMTSHGASAFAESSPLARMWRDANTAARHAALSSPVNYELHGGSFLGHEPISQLL